MNMSYFAVHSMGHQAFFFHSVGRDLCDKRKNRILRLSSGTKHIANLLYFFVAVIERKRASQLMEKIP